MRSRSRPTTADMIDFSSDDLPAGRMRELFVLWRERCGERAMPARRDMPPAAMVRHLPRLALVDVLDTEPLYSVRLWGTELADRSGIDLTGRPVDFPGVRERAEWVVEHRKPYFVFDRPIVWSDRDYRYYDALALPLSEDGVAVDKILYYFEFH